jgi:hypothetical protein
MAPPLPRFEAEHGADRLVVARTPNASWSKILPSSDEEQRLIERQIRADFTNASFGAGVANSIAQCVGNVGCNCF